MVTLRTQLHFLAALWARFEAATDDAPINTELLSHVRVALTEASVAAVPGLPVVVTLGSVDELNALTACFEVGGELHPDVTGDQWDSILASDHARSSTATTSWAAVGHGKKAVSMKHVTQLLGSLR